MHNPELHALARIDWQLFCTFTFKSERKSDAIRQSMFFALLRTQAKVWKVHFKRLLWCLRRETGEGTGRLHLHAIIAGLPPQAVTERNCLAVMSQWESFGGGMARVRAYDSSLDGLDYVLKGSGLTGSRATRWAGDYHELTKFGGFFFAPHPNRITFATCNPHATAACILHWPSPKKLPGALE